MKFLILVAIVLGIILLSFLESPAPQLVDVSRFHCQSGYDGFEVFGDLTNTWSEPLELIAEISLDTGDGRPDIHAVPIKPSKVEPGSKARFHLERKQRFASYVKEVECELVGFKSPDGKKVGYSLSGKALKKSIEQEEKNEQ